MSFQSAMPSVLSSVFTVTCGAGAGEPGECPDGPDGGAGKIDLRQVWAQIPDPRDRRGRRHSLEVMFALVQAAIVSGATTFAAVRHWIAAAPEQVLESVGARRNARTGRLEAPPPTRCAGRWPRSIPPRSTPPTRATGPRRCPTCTTPTT